MRLIASLRQTFLATIIAVLLIATPATAQIGGGPISGGGGGGASGVTTLTDDIPCSGTQSIRRNAGDTAWECYTPSTGTITGSTGAADDKLLCSDGTGGSTVGVCTVGDLDNLRLDGNTLSSTDANGNVNIVPNGTGKVGIGITNPYRKFSVNGNASFGDGDQTQDALDAVLHIALNNTDAPGETFDATVGWYGFSMSAVNGNSTLFAIGHENGVGPVIGARQADLLLGSINASGTFTEMARLGSSGTGPAMTVKGYVSTWGRNCLNSDFTSTSVTFANLTGMSTTLTASRKYAFRLTARYNDSTAADGANFDFDGGTATATTFGVNCRSIDTTGLVAGIISSDATALATDHTASDVTGAASLVCEGFIEVNAGGTFLPRAAQQAASGGTLTVNKGSCLFVDDMSFN